jgi:hypothetical protein
MKVPTTHRTLAGRLREEQHEVPHAGPDRDRGRRRVPRRRAADLSATAAPVDEATRRRVITAVLDLQNRPEFATRVSRQNLDDWLAGSPLVEIVFDDEQWADKSRRPPCKRT